MMIDTDSLRYLYRVYWDRARTPLREIGRGEARTPAFDLSKILHDARAREGGAFDADPFVTVHIWRPRTDGEGPRTEVHLRVLADHLLPVGVDREVD